jgi:hypothetical protein
MFARFLARCYFLVASVAGQTLKTRDIFRSSHLRFSDVIVPFPTAGGSAAFTFYDDLRS